MAGELEWSEGEPAINVYSAGGGFGTHKDHMALTVLISLTAPATDFSGGGTGFWSALDEEMMGGVPSGSPTRLARLSCACMQMLEPSAGSATALLRLRTKSRVKMSDPPHDRHPPHTRSFGGSLSHAGMPVESGMRSVFVCSFSTRTEVSAEDRVNGLQCNAEASSSLREFSSSGGSVGSGGDVGSGFAKEQPLARVKQPSTAPIIAPCTVVAAPEATAAAPARAVEATSAASSSSKSSAKARLRALNELQAAGLISDEEYDAKRAAILAGI